MSALAANARASIPRLWLKRLVLLESPDKKDSPIRDVIFRRGLNIIWGVELPDEAGTNDAHPVTLSGHSVGKTTLCRLIRYCLGETTFGNPGAMSRIKNAFPQGWAGMELVVEGREWAVLKSIGQSGNSTAAEGATIESLFELDHKASQFRDFMKNLSDSMLSGLAASTPPNSAKPYEWKHLLAWLTRDQEARFQSLHDWRSSRSVSDTPRFDKPKEHALYLIRLVLDLLQEKELDASRALADAERELKEVESRMTELKRQPEYRFNEAERILKELLNLPMHDIVNFDESDMTSPVFIRHSELDQAVSALQAEIERIERRAAQKRVWLASYDEQRRVFRAALDATEAGTEFIDEEGPEDETIRRLRTLRGKDCTYGNVAFLECSYVKARLAEAEKIIDFSREREERRAASETEQRLQILEQQRKDHDEVAGLLEELRRKLNGDLTEKREKELELIERRAELQRIDHHLSQRKQSLDLIEGRTPNTELQRETARAEGLRESIQQQQAALTELQNSYQTRLDTIGRIYDALIKSCLSDTYSGALHMPKGELQFRIAESTGLSGEAVETLALVLADVAVMMCSCQGVGHHPRFLIHDSPREADLDRHIYNRYLTAMWILTEEHGGPDAAPFQYIVTTTSRPPDELQKAIRLELKAHPPEHMLFGRLLTNPPTTEISDLFEEAPSK